MWDVLDPYQYFVFSKCHATHAKEDWILKIHLPSTLPTEGMCAFGIGRRNVNPCCGSCGTSPQLACTWPLGADASCIIYDVSFILQSLICLRCNCWVWPLYDVTAGDCGSFTLQQVMAEWWFSIGLYPVQFCSGLILAGYGTIGEWMTLDPLVRN